MNVLREVEQGYFRGDSAAARYLNMDRMTFARLVKVDGPKPKIKGGFRYWSKASLDEWMTADARSTAYTVRPQLAARNRMRAADRQQVSTPINTSATT